MRVGGATSRLDLRSLTPLSVAGCGRLQLEVPLSATSVDYCKQLIIDPTFCGSSFSTGRLLAIEDFDNSELVCNSARVQSVMRFKYRDDEATDGQASSCGEH